MCPYYNSTTKMCAASNSTYTVAAGQIAMYCTNSSSWQNCANYLQKK